MTFLCMDTGGEYGVLALAEDDGGLLRAVLVFEGRRTLSRRLLGEVDTLLQSNGQTLDDMTAFAVGVGPGSFTGVRVGVTTARTLAQVTGKPLVGVNTLDAYAAALIAPPALLPAVEALRTGPIMGSSDEKEGLESSSPQTWGAGGGVLVPVLPSRRDEVYAAVYENGVLTDGPFATSPAELVKQIAHRGVTLCGDTRTVPDWPGQARYQPWTPPDGLARLAARRLAAGETDDPLGLLPLYVVAPSISTPKAAVL